MSHGWPGPAFEYLRIVEKPAHPERFGGNAKDAFAAIVPSLPASIRTLLPRLRHIVADGGYAKLVSRRTRFHASAVN